MNEPKIWDKKEEFSDKFTVTEAEEELSPYSREDTKQVRNFCNSCSLMSLCPILPTVNQMEKNRCIRNGTKVKTVEREWGCTLHRVDE